LKELLLIIPSYNEADNIRTVLNSIRKTFCDCDILIINDGSTDNTSDIAREENVKVIDLPINLGIGGCVQTGFLYAKKIGYKYALQFDGDDQHNAEEIEVILNEIKYNSSDLVIGSRFLNKVKGYNPSLYRRIGIKIFEILIMILIAKKITDSTSGFRIYSSRAISFLAENYPIDFPEPEAIILLQKNGFKISEVKTTMKKRRSGDSSIQFKGALYMLKVTLGMIMTYLRPCVK
tara:strand:- start:2 stop:703 length:702 start_codon:yes stop_codon:yes gene_type:complete